jgi:hypothetical protein
MLSIALSIFRAWRSTKSNGYAEWALLGDATRAKWGVMVPTAGEFKAWLPDALRQQGEGRAGLSLRAEALAPADVPARTVRYWGDGPAPPETATIGFKAEVSAHRMTRQEAEGALRGARANIERALSHAMLPGGAEYEGSGQACDLVEDADGRVFSLSFPVYLGIDV